MNKGKKRNFLYIGGFQLPDKNAAAFRVLSIAKIIRELGHQVIFINAINTVDVKSRKNNKKSDISKFQWKNYEGFLCLEYKKEDLYRYLISCKRIIKVIEKYDIDSIIAYNYPAIALDRLRKYCKKKKILCYGDVTEWYVPSGNLIFRIFKGLDTEFRMRCVQPKLDGIIAISEYLYCYYYKKVNTVKIPPLIDLDEEKCKIDEKKSPDKILELIYAGSPSAQKERLDLIVETVQRSEIPVKLIVVGITLEEYKSIYGKSYSGGNIEFLGRIEHREVIRKIKLSDWMIVLRDKNKIVTAGFPTKVVESISCGIPVIANRFSNIDEFLDDNNSILMNNIAEFDSNILIKASNKKVDVDDELFDYRKYIDVMQKLIE